MAKQNFDKFINVKIKGAKKKEQIKQEKKLAKKEREAYFIEKKREMRAAKKLQEELQAKPENYSAKKPAEPAAKKFKTSKADKKPDRALSPKKERPEKNSQAGIAKKETAHEYSTKKNTAPSPKKYNKDINIARPEKTDDSGNTSKVSDGNKKAFKKPSLDKKPAKKVYDADLPYERKPITKPVVIPNPASKRITPKIKTAAPITDSDHKFSKENKGKAQEKLAESTIMPLNKFIAHGGICSRRDAGELVKSGKVMVNGKQVNDPGYKVQEGDTVTANGKKVTTQVNLVYILLNKPKDFITTSEDPQGRKTVLDIVKSATKERIYPVGRLDRNTSGVLLLTNDGELAQQLTHPSFEVRKIYEAKLDKPLAKADFDKLLNGVTLEDGDVHADSLAYADSKDKSIIGIEIHSGRNRVVRRMFEHLGYDVKNLDRVMFANLTKKNVERGKWRFLNDKEVRLLKFFNKSKR